MCARNKFTPFILFYSPAETITLRGEQERLGPALTLVYSKANSIVVKEVEAPSWLHRFIIGRKGEKINKIMEEYPKVHIEFTEGQNKIGIEGPPEEAECAKAVLEKMTAELKSKMAFAEIEIEQKYHRHIIGKGGANVNRIKGDSNLSIKIPSDTDPSNIIRLEGSPEGVALAKKELLEMVHKMENEKSRDILIEQRFHKTLIGAAGAKNAGLMAAEILALGDAGLAERLETWRRDLSASITEEPSDD